MLGNLRGDLFGAVGVNANPANGNPMRAFTPIYNCRRQGRDPPPPRDPEMPWYDHIRLIRQAKLAPREGHYLDTPTSPREIHYENSPFSPTYQYWEEKIDRTLPTRNTKPIPFDPYGVIGSRKMNDADYATWGGGPDARWNNNQKMYEERPATPPFASPELLSPELLSPVRSPLPAPVSAGQGRSPGQWAGVQGLDGQVFHGNDVSNDSIFDFLDNVVAAGPRYAPARSPQNNGLLNVSNSEPRAFLSVRFDAAARNPRSPAA